MSFAETPGFTRGSGGFRASRGGSIGPDSAGIPQEIRSIRRLMPIRGFPLMRSHPVRAEVDLHAEQVVAGARRPGSASTWSLVTARQIHVRGRLLSLLTRNPPCGTARRSVTEQPHLELGKASVALKRHLLVRSPSRTLLNSSESA